ncbi:MAG: pilus assembly protein [Acidimicrobiia bacterium]|nr:pilus assembly protein [Acidimicrobiia bacterium]
MSATASTASRRAAGERGASLVEFALIVPILFLLLFGIIEFGFAFNDYQSIRQGAREGAREAVVTNYGAVTSCGIDGTAAGAIDDVKRMICQTKARTGLGNSVRVAVRVVADPNESQWKGNSVKICETRLVGSITGLFTPFTGNLPLRTQITMRAEKSMGVTIDLGNISTWQESDPSGANWSWC